MNIYLRVGAALAVVSVLSGCATVIRGTKQEFSIVSVPPGADVALSEGGKCVTPCKLRLKRNRPFIATFTKPGYQKLKVNVDSELNGQLALAGNLIIGGIIGIIVDTSDGSLRALTPSPLEVTLVSAEPTPAPFVMPAAATDTTAPTPTAVTAAPAAPAQ